MSDDCSVDLDFLLTALVHVADLFLAVVFFCFSLAFCLASSSFSSHLVSLSRFCCSTFCASLFLFPVVMLSLLYLLVPSDPLLSSN